jgi:hypothetical protein
VAYQILQTYRQTLNIGMQRNNNFKSIQNFKNMIAEECDQDTILFYKRRIKVLEGFNRQARIEIRSLTFRATGQLIKAAGENRASKGLNVLEAYTLNMFSSILE